MIRPSSRARASFPILAVLVVLTSGLAAQSGAPQSSPAAPKPGPVIESFGASHDVPVATLKPSPDVEYKVKFDVASGNADRKTVNVSLDTVARFVNMHVRAGVPLNHVKAAVILHGSAATDALGDAGYRARHGVDNPNLPLIKALTRAGVRIYLCGQSAVGRGLQWTEIAPEVEVALSAITAHAVLTREGYSTNPF